MTMPAYDGFTTYISTLVKKIQQGATITVDGRDSIDTFIKTMQSKLLISIIHRAESKGRKTVHGADIFTVLRFILNEPLIGDCCEYITAVLDSMDQIKDVERVAGMRKKRVTLTQRSGVLFSPSRVAPLLKRRSEGMRITESGSVAFACALQFVCGHVIKRAITVRDADKKQRISSVHVDVVLNVNDILK